MLPDEQQQALQLIKRLREYRSLALEANTVEDLKRLIVYVINDFVEVIVEEASLQAFTQGDVPSREDNN